MEMSDTKQINKKECFLPLRKIKEKKAPIKGMFVDIDE